MDLVLFLILGDFNRGKSCSFRIFEVIKTVLQARGEVSRILRNSVTLWKISGLQYLRPRSLSFCFYPEFSAKNQEHGKSNANRITLINFSNKKSQNFKPEPKRFKRVSYSSSGSQFSLKTLFSSTSSSSYLDFPSSFLTLRFFGSKLRKL